MCNAQQTVHKPPGRGRDSVGPRATGALQYTNIMGTGRSRRNAEGRYGCFLHAPATSKTLCPAGGLRLIFMRICGERSFSLPVYYTALLRLSAADAPIEVLVKSLRGRPGRHRVRAADLRQSSARTCATASSSVIAAPEAINRVTSSAPIAAPSTAIARSRSSGTP